MATMEAAIKPADAGINPALAPGLYEDLPSEAYHALPYCSNSRLSLLKRSPAHLQADLISPRTPTEAMRLGTAIHSAVLEPADFAGRYTFAVQCEGKKKDGSQCTNPGTRRVQGEWRCGVHPLPGERDPQEVLSIGDFAVCKGVADAVNAHPRIGRLLAGEGRNELTVVWDDAETGVRCKARIDRLALVAGGVLVDLKTTTDARPDAFERTVFERGYFRQAAMYADALAAHGVQTSHMVIVAAEKEAPFAVAGYRLSEPTVEEGRREYRALLERYAECQSKNEWPGYGTNLTEINLPAWAWRKLEAA